MRVSGCAVPGCLSGPADGSRLCPGCRNRLAEQLAALPALYESCAGALQRRRDRLPQRVSGWSAGGITLDERVLEVRADAVDVLSSWCHLVVQERGISGPGRREFGRLVAFLRDNLDWLAAHPAADDLAGEITGLVEAMRDVSHGERKPAALGRCARAGCGRVVHARGASLRCEAGHVWQPHQWLLLARGDDPARAA